MLSSLDVACSGTTFFLRALLLFFSGSPEPLFFVLRLPDHDSYFIAISMFYGWFLVLTKAVF